MQVAHKIELRANNKATTYCKKACGTSRFVWNWGLANWEQQYKNGQKPSGFSLKKEFNQIKLEQYPWVYEVTKYAAQQPFLDLQEAWERFFKKKAERPRFKKKGKAHDSFYIGGDQLKVLGKKVWIPNLGWVRMREELRFQGKINSAVVSRTAGRWYIAIQVETSIQFQACEKQASIGIDLGINRLATLSNGIIFAAPKPLKAELRKLKRKQRKLSKKQKNSRNSEKQKIKIARLHKRISQVRLDTLHKISSWVTSNFSEIGIEDLNVKGMMANHRLAKAIADLGFYEFRRQLEYKSQWKSGNVIVKDRFFPSSKLCSGKECGKKNEALTLKDRIFSCPHCGYQIDRDLNAAKNLDPVPKVLREFTPEEMTALLKWVHPVLATSIDETGIQHQVAC